MIDDTDRRSLPSAFRLVFEIVGRYGVVARAWLRFETGPLANVDVGPFEIVQRPHHRVVRSPVALTEPAALDRTALNAFERWLLLRYREFEKSDDIVTD
jgi:hypothetical protein